MLTFPGRWLHNCCWSHLPWFTAGCGGASHWKLEDENYEGWRVKVGGSWGHAEAASEAWQLGEHAANSWSASASARLALL